MEELEALAGRLGEEDDDLRESLAREMARREREHPSGRIPDPDAAWARFTALRRAREEKGPRTEAAPTARRPRQRLPRRAAAWAAAAALVVCLAGAQATGADVVGSLVRWTQGIFHMSPSGETGEAQAVRQALAAGEVPQGYVPAWVPEGYVALTPRFTNSDFCDDVVLTYLRGKETLYVEITVYRNSRDLKETLTFSPGDEEVEEYVHGGRSFYLFENHGLPMASWSDGENLAVDLWGSVTKEELKGMIDSISG